MPPNSAVPGRYDASESQDDLGSQSEGWQSGGVCGQSYPPSPGNVPNASGSSGLSSGFADSSVRALPIAAAAVAAKEEQLVPNVRHDGLELVEVDHTADEDPVIGAAGQRERRLIRPEVTEALR